MVTSFDNIPWYKKIEVLRTLKGWSQEQTAEKCCTTQKNYWLWETGKCYPRQSSRKAIASAFEVSITDIFPNHIQKKVC